MTSFRLCALVGLTAALATGCSCGPPGSGLAINVTFAPSSASKCTVVGVKKVGSSSAFESKGLARPKDNTLIVGVERTSDIRGPLVPFARGFATADCSGPLVEEARAPSAVNLDLPGRQEVSLVLEGSTSDGGKSDAGTPDSGTPDGGDADAGQADGGDGGCVPSLELCGDGLDNDCDGLIDCRDPACSGSTCTDNDSCTQTDVCLGDGGCAGSAIVCSTPGQCEVAPGTCTGGACSYDAGVGLACNTNGICRSDKTCADGGTEVFCANAIDDDTDLLTDCADPDCASQACDAGPSACFLGASCSSNACVRTKPIACTPPGACFVSTGACIEATGCPFLQLDAGTPCPAGFCRSDGGCAPPELCSNGVDDDGDLLVDCADPDCNAASCDDKNACTFGTVCAAGVCGGGTLCPSTSFCMGPGSCGTDGGCQFAPPLYAKCDGGFCRADGTCGAPFPFTPSNFDPNALSVPDASVKIDCLAEFDSDVPFGNGGFANWCGPRPNVFVMAQTDGGEDVAVLAMPNLDVTDGGALYLTGGRPVVLAIFGRAVVDGRIVAGPKPGVADRGAGGSLPGILSKGHCNANGAVGRGLDGVSGNNTSGGGGGGSFGLPGAIGGIGASVANSGGAGGLVNGNAELIPLRGGCPGGQGGSNFAFGLALGGYGGGALQLSVAGSLSVSGYLAAPGSGGQGCDSNNNLNAGGSGAGSGGALLLEANSLRLFPTAAITAHGGGGGEGDGDPQGGEPGDGGESGHVVNALVAQGGTGGSARGGKGGNGGVLGTSPSAGSAGTSGSGRNGGGGGGGASVGRIRFNIVTQCKADAGTISPLFTGTCP